MKLEFQSNITNRAPTDSSGVTIGGQDAFQYLIVDIGPGQSFESEPGAMTSMEYGLDLKTKFNGGFLGAILLKFLGSESIFRNVYINKSQKTLRLMLSQSTPGNIEAEQLNDSILYIQPGAYIASTPGVKISLSWAGFSSWLAGEGLLRLRISGKGSVWYGSYGAVIEHDVDGSIIVDSNHLLSYPPSIKLKVGLAGGIFSSIFGGEGLVLHLYGKGKIKLQTRSLAGLGSWINPRF